jgi:hypothetical protein
VIIFDLKECPFLRASVQIVGVTFKKVDDLWFKDPILGKVIFRPTLNKSPISQKLIWIDLKQIESLSWTVL